VGAQRLAVQELLALRRGLERRERRLEAFIGLPPAAFVFAMRSLLRPAIVGPVRGAGERGARRGMIAGRHAAPRSSAMLSIGNGLVAIAFASASALAQEAPAPPPTPQQQFDALMAEYHRSPRHGELTDAERMTLVAASYRQHYEVSLRLVELAERCPSDPIALKALIQAAWQVDGTPWTVEQVGEDRASGRALALLQRDHLASAELGPLCRRISWGHRPEYEPFLRALLDGSPHPEIRGIACLSLAHCLNTRLARLELLEAQPATRAAWSALYGADHVARLLALDRAAATREIEALLERASSRHGDVALPEGGTVGERAIAELFELRHLCVGAMAPEIEGEDQHGVRFKLGDHRGKVVLLDFWSWA